MSYSHFTDEVNLKHKLGWRGLYQELGALTAMMESNDSHRNLTKEKLGDATKLATI